MLHLRLLPNFTLASANGRERSFADLLADYDVIMLTRAAAMQFSLDVALSPYRVARAPPQRQHGGRRDTAA